MPEIASERRVDAPPGRIWEVLAAVEHMAEWYPEATRAEKLSGPDAGVGREQRVNIKTGGRRGAVDTEVVEWDEERRVAFRRLREFAGGKQAPLFAKDVVTVVEIEPAGDGTSRVRCRTTWEPEGLKGMRAAGTLVQERNRNLVEGVLDGIAVAAESVDPPEAG